jgi:alkylhydroperoxidase/carboxymuconolactone decarboxylase family protein YurZ
MISPEKRRELAKNYEAQLGFVPDHLQLKLDLFESIAPEIIVSIEEARAGAITPPALTAREVQLLEFAIYAALDLELGAHAHAAAALRAGATVDELAGVAGVVFVARGAPALNLAVAAITSAAAAKKPV